MKLLASLLITVSLICGALAASTAYLAPLSLSDEALTGLTLAAPAGLVTRLAADPADAPSMSLSGEQRLAALETRTPIVRAGVELTPATIAELRSAGVKSVKVRSFSFMRWQFNWVFGLAMVGLLGGAWLMRREASAAGLVAAGASGGAKTPDATQSLRAAQEGIAGLRAELDSMPGGEQSGRRLALILQRVSAIQEGPLTDFIASRPRLIATIGLSGYATVMDKFAGAERQVNRSWSAAADGYLEESEACLAECGPLFAEAIERLGS